MLKLKVKTNEGEAILEYQDRTIATIFFDQVLYGKNNERIDFFRYSVHLKKFVEIASIELLESDELRIC